MSGDPDEMWKPGYGGGVIESPSIPTAPPPPQPLPPATRGGDVGESAALEFDGVGTQTPVPPTDVPGRSRRGRALSVLIAVALVVGAAFVLANNRRDSERAAIDAPAGADPRRLPEKAEPLWSTALVERRPGVGPRDLLVHDRSVMAVLDDEAGGSVILTLDADDGAVRWRRTFDFDPTGVRILGGFDQLVVLERNDVRERQLFAIDLSDGSTRWELPTADNGIHVALNGASVITRVSFTGNERLTFVDPATGDEVARVEGRLVGTDLGGTWYVSNSRRVVEIDLSDGWSEPVELVASGATFGETVGVVDGRILVMDDGVLSEVSPIDGIRTALVVRPFGNDIAAVSILGVGGSMFVAVGDGRVVGATLGADDEADVVSIEWSRDGSLREAALSSRGIVLSMTDDQTGPAGRLVVDALTGTTIADAVGPLTDDEVPRIVRDGVVVTNTELGQERVGYDLDGTERWRLAAPGAMRLGDRLLVTFEDTPDGSRISAFGDSV